VPWMAQLSAAESVPHSLPPRHSCPGERSEQNGLMPAMVKLLGHWEELTRRRQPHCRAVDRGAPTTAPAWHCVRSHIDSGGGGDVACPPGGMGGYFGGGGVGLGGGGEGGGGEGEGGGGLGEVCCAAQLHPKRQMIANRNVNIWDTTDRSLGSKEIPVGGPDAFLCSATACQRSSHKFDRYKKNLHVRQHLFIRRSI
jgi:hypothetical protein